MKRLVRFIRDLFCKHRYVLLAVWHTQPDRNVFEGTKWDGAFCNFCVKCRRFEPEIKWGEKDEDGIYRYRDGIDFFLLTRGRGPAPKDLEQWSRVRDVRESTWLQ